MEERERESAVCVKKGNRDCSRQKQKIFAFRPFKFLLKNNKYRYTGQLKRAKSHDLTALTSCTTWQSLDFGDILFYNKRYVLDGWIVIFCCLKKKKKWKVWRARFTRDLIFFILLVAQLLLRTDAISLFVPPFQANSVICSGFEQTVVAVETYNIAVQT